MCVENQMNFLVKSEVHCQQGNELTPPTLTLAEIPGMLMGLPAFASSIKVFTCTQFKRFKQKSDKTNSIL
jgi:hypothetical protein